jgi:hypothetical protein
MPEALLEDPAVFSDLDAGEALAAKLNEDAESGFTVVPYHDAFYVLDAQGRPVTQTGTPPRRVNPTPGIPDRYEPPTKFAHGGNGIRMSEPDEHGHSHYLGGTHRHG